jgi:hypothetical protein
MTDAVDVQDLMAVIRDQRISVFGLPPSVLALITPKDLHHQTRTSDGGSTARHIIALGEPCPSGVAECWSADSWPWRFSGDLISTENWLALIAYRRDQDNRGIVFETVPVGPPDRTYTFENCE